MSSALPAAPPVSARLTGVGAVIFLANGGLLVLQLVAGRLLSPFIGSSLETWTSVIAAFLSGIALGNFLGGRMTAQRPSAGRLAAVLLAGVAATLWVAALPMLLNATGVHTSLPWGVSIPVLAFALCLPVATVLSLLTPLAIRFGIPDVSRTGSVAGTIFALSSLGCLIGNYLTGFVLIPALSVNMIVYAVAGLLAVTGAATMVLGGNTTAAKATPASASTEPQPPPSGVAALPLSAGFVIVFLCSFAGMGLELAASRMIALLVGVSLFTWTGVIGVMLAGTTVGNWLGGRIADRAHRADPTGGRAAFVLTGCLLAAGVLSVLVLVFFALTSHAALHRLSLIGYVVAVTFLLFFLPMALLGTISPQVIRLCVKDVGGSGQTAGRIYAVSTSGAIAGTFAAGYFLISTVGMKGTILFSAVLPCVAVCTLVRVWKHPAMLYVMSVVGGAMLGGAVLLFRGGGEMESETNYYTIRIGQGTKWTLSDDPLPDALAAAVGPLPNPEPQPLRMLYLDHLLHSEVNLSDPQFFRYRHEQVQLEAVYAAAARKPQAQRVLVIGGGGYTFPRATRTLVPTAAVDVVEIDPGVTAAAYRWLGLDEKLAIRSFHRDGRQFVAQTAEAGVYDVVSLDAVNDLSVPGHLLTVGCNESVKRTLAADGVYLVTVIDLVADGRLWKAAYHTLKKSFQHVHFTLPATDLAGYRHSPAAHQVAAKRLGRDTVTDAEVTNEDAIRSLDRVVIVLYASDTPLDAAAMDRVVRSRTKVGSDIYVLPDELLREMLGTEKELILTDQYAPVDNLMAPVFLRR